MSVQTERRYRVAYAGDDSFVTCLVALLDRADVELVACLTADDERYTSTVGMLSGKAGATVIRGNPGPSGWDTLNLANVDLLVSAAYGYRIPVDRLRIETMVNIHPSFLPNGRGPNPLVHLAGQATDGAGVSIHLLDQNFDTGPVLLQERFKDEPRCPSLNDLTLLALARAPVLLNRLLDGLEHVLGNASVQTAGSYWPGLDRSASVVDLSIAAGEEIENAIRRFSCQGFTLRLADGSLLEAKTAFFTAASHCFEPGRLLGRLRDDYLLSAAGGLVRAIPFCEHP